MINYFKKNIKILVKQKLLRGLIELFESNSKLLKFIHTDLCEFEGLLNHDGNTHFNAFIYDFLKINLKFID